jgi:hypothetical protein
LKINQLEGKVIKANRLAELASVSGVSRGWQAVSISGTYEGQKQRI